jgi:group I intron endonuclease
MIATENLKGVSGVYCAIHRDSLKCYVGSSISMGGRRKGHIMAARNGAPANFHAALRKYGKDAFDFEVLERCGKEHLRDRETFLIKFYQSSGLKGFNTSPTAQFRPDGIVSEATRARLRESVKNRPPIREETRRLMAEAGRNRSPETHKRMSEAQKRKPPISEETRARMVAALYRRPKRTEATCAKLSASLMGHKVSPETRAKLRLAVLGKTRPPEVGAKIAAANKGRKHSAQSLDNMRKSKTPEWRAKVSATMKKVCAERKSRQGQSL